MPTYRASAPFFEGDKGDRRVTGWQYAAKWRTKTVEDRFMKGERRWFIAEFSREFGHKTHANGS